VDQVLLGKIPTGDDQCRFNYADLELAIKKIIKDRVGSEDCSMSASINNPTCPTFVVSKIAGIVNGPPAVFRSYRVRGYGASTCAMWEAARATTAAPTFFKAMEIGPSPAIAYVDGGLGYNNPSQLAREEAKRLWPTRNSCCLVSIGTGHPSAVSIASSSDLENNVNTQRTVFESVLNFVPELLTYVPGYKTVQNFPRGALAVVKMASALSSLVTDSESVNDRLWIASQEPHADAPFKYFRFNVERDVGDIGLGEWARSKELAALTLGYLGRPAVVEMKAACVSLLVRRE
jgi:hypothetical protein